MTVYFTQEHEWIAVDGGVGTVGISDYAQNQMGDVVFVEVPEIGITVEKGQEAAVVESVKAASEIYSPVSGEIFEANESLADAPATVNSSAEADGWFFKIKISDEAELGNLMDETAYKAYLEELE